MRLKRVGGWWWNKVETWHFCPQIWIGSVGGAPDYKYEIYIFVGWLKGHFIFIVR